MVAFDVDFEEWGFYDGNRRLVAQENLIDPALEALVSRTCVGLKLERDLLDFIHLNSMASVVRMSAAVVCIGEGAGGALRGYRHGTRMVALTPPRASSSSTKKRVRVFDFDAIQKTVPGAVLSSRTASFTVASF